MNKKIKLIELLNKIANGEDIPTKIKCKGKDFYFNKYEKSIDYLYRVDKDGNGWLVVQDIALTDEVEILEDNTEEIEELKTDKNGFIKTNNGTWKGRKLDVAFADKINELVKAVKKIRKDLNK